MILVDVNVFMDVLTGRIGFESSIKIIDLVRKGKIKGYISALTIPILWFLLTKYKEFGEAKNDVRDITTGFNIISLNYQIIEKAFESSMKDFEDGIQFYSALEGMCEVLITRNKEDFKMCKEVRIMTPEEFLFEVEIK